MLRSMFSAISGLRSHQTMMDVTGNNIANVNTSGYKSTRATFQEALTQVTRGATGGTPAAGGTNPFQVGLGANVAGIDQNFSQGSVQTTGRTTDLSISGEGFFAVGDQAGVTSYTRSGAFNFDAEGYLVNANGKYVHGDTGPVQVDLVNYSDPQIGSDGSVTAVNNATGTREDIDQITLARFVNPEGLARVGEGLYEETANSGGAAFDIPGAGGNGSLQSGTLEMSNVDLAAEFTNMIIAQRGFQANARTITSSDEVLQELVNLKR